MKYAIRFNTTSEGLAQSYSVLPYQKYLTEIWNAGHKVNMSGFKSQEEAELMANSFVGLNLTDEAVATRLKKNGLLTAEAETQAEVFDDPAAKPLGEDELTDAELNPQ